MKKLIYLLTVISLTTLTGKSQSSVQLDEKNGFKDIKLGDSFSKWSSQLKYIDTRDGTEKIYKYVGTCCQDVFGTAVESIDIIFANDKIIYIGITLKPYQDNRANGMPAKFRHPNDDFNKLVVNFKSLFGDTQEGVPNENAGLMYSKIWEGQKVVLLADYYFMGSYDFSKISVLDKTYFKKKKENGF